jgi:hypothetical protein
VSNGNAAWGILLTAAILTGMHQARGGSVRRHAPERQWARPEAAELGDTRIPVRTIHRRTASEPRTGRGAVVHRSTTEENPEYIVGYVDPKRGPAAFRRLTKVNEGDRVKVVRRDHSVAWFKVDSVRRLQKIPYGRHDPADDVRRVIAREPSATGRPQLRLISVPAQAAPTAEPPQNVVVSAHLDRPATDTEGAQPPR